VTVKKALRSEGNLKIALAFEKKRVENLEVQLQAKELAEVTLLRDRKKEMRQLGIDSESCQREVTEAENERDRVTKISERECSNLEKQLIKLRESKEKDEAKLKDQVRVLELDQKHNAKERRQFLLDKASLELEINVCRGESRRVELRKEEIRKERQKYKTLINTGHKRIKLAVARQTTAVEDTTKVCFHPVGCFFFVVLLCLIRYFLCLFRLCNNGLQSLNSQRN
jgi:hypothetical protein